MKNIKIIISVSILAVMLCPTAVSAVNDFYRDSYSMWRFSDLSSGGSTCTGVTEHSERYGNATAGIYDANGYGNSQTVGAGKTAYASHPVNIYNHKHSLTAP